MFCQVCKQFHSQSAHFHSKSCLILTEVSHILYVQEKQAGRTKLAVVQDVAEFKEEAEEINQRGQPNHGDHSFSRVGRGAGKGENAGFRAE